MTNPWIPRDGGFLSDPRGQAAAVGALTLIPVRNYPRWLRRALIWGPSVAGTIGCGYIVASAKALPKLDDERFFQERGSTEKNEEAGQQVEDEVKHGEVGPPLNPAMRTIVFVAGGAAVGAALTGMTAAGFWADEKIDRGLRKLKVPLPRVVMGCTAGAVTWRQVTNQNTLMAQQRARAQTATRPGGAPDDAGQAMHVRSSSQGG